MPLGHFFHDWSLKVNFAQEVTKSHLLKKLNQKSQKNLIKGRKKHTKKNSVLLINGNNINMSERAARSKTADSKVCNICVLSLGSRQSLSLFLFITASILRFRPQYWVCPNSCLGYTYQLIRVFPIIKVYSGLHPDCGRKTENRPHCGQREIGSRTNCGHEC